MHKKEHLSRYRNTMINSIFKNKAEGYNEYRKPSHSTTDPSHALAECEYITSNLASKITNNSIKEETTKQTLQICLKSTLKPEQIKTSNTTYSICEEFTKKVHKAQNKSKTNNLRAEKPFKRISDKGNITIQIILIGIKKLFE